MRARATTRSVRWRSRAPLIALACMIALATSGCLIGEPRPGDLRTVPGGDILPANYVAPPTTVVHDVAYGPAPQQVLDLYLPPGASSGPLPVLVYLHAGGWVAGDRSVIPEIVLRQVTRARMALVSIDYRLATRQEDESVVDAFPAAPQDVDRAIRFVKAHAANWNLDATRVVIAGASSGGHLAALAGVAPNVFRDPALPPELAAVSPNVLGVIDWVGPSDLSTFAQAGGWAPALLTGFLGCAPVAPETCSSTDIAAASPVNHLDASDPPAYLIYGRDDGLVVPATQGLPLAIRWAAARGDFARPDVLRGIRYEVVATGHNVSPDVENVRQLELWLDLVVAGTLH